jgi:dTDP-4-amino-4,6-dideoxygalactose transaminase
MGKSDINCVFHYIPLHSSQQSKLTKAGSRSFKNAISISERIVKLPLWIGLEEAQAYVLEKALNILDRERYPCTSVK